MRAQPNELGTAEILYTRDINRNLTLKDEPHTSTHPSPVSLQPTESIRNRNNGFWMDVAHDSAPAMMIALDVLITPRLAKAYSKQLNNRTSGTRY